MDHKQQQWQPKLLRTTMWIRIHDLWLAQNDDRHGRTSKAKTQANHHQTLCTIRALYLLKDSVLSEDGYIFYEDLVDAHLLQPTPELQAWVTTHQGLIAYSVMVAKLATHSQTKPIMEYFTTIHRIKHQRRAPTDVLLPASITYQNTKLTAAYAY
jgi:hypothetical protein